MSDIEPHGANLYEKPADITSAKSYVRRWLEAIELSSEEEKDWRKVADTAIGVYNADKPELVGTQFNIYHANIETLVPALYNSTPTPDVRRRYNDRDPAAKAASDVIERALTYLVDEYDFDDVMEQSVFHFAVSGRGVARVYYTAEEMQSDMLDDQGQPVMDVGTQSITCRVVPWAGFRRGPGRVWDDVPWVAFPQYMSRSELQELSPKYGGLVNLDMYITEHGENHEGVDADKPESDIFKRALVWEVWDKRERQVLFIAPSFPDDVLVAVADPLGLKNFYPVPRPMQMLRGDDTLVPMCGYHIQKPLLDEIDTLHRRIKRLAAQLRPRALGPSDVDMDKLATADDGQIVGVSNIVQFLDAGGMEKMLAWFPMEPTIAAIKMLYERMEIAKQQLFEVSGLADIFRGQSDPNEKLGTQEIKQQWGSMRIQRQQQEVQRFARDLLRLKAELLAEKIKPENLAMMTGIELDDAAMQVITNEKMRGYRIDIETDSTIQADTARNQQAMASFVQGAAQYFQAMMPAVMAFPQSKTAVITIFSAFCRNFKLGKEVDSVLDQLADDAKQADQQPQPDPQQEAMALEREKMQGEQQMKQAELQMKQGEMQAKQEAGQMEVPLKQADLQLKAMDVKIKEMDLAIKQQQLVHADANINMQKSTADSDRGFKQQDMLLRAKQMDDDKSYRGEELKLKAKGKDGGTKVQIGAGDDSMKQVSGIMQGLAKLIAEGNRNTAELIAEGNAQLVKAVTAPKTVTTPDGRTYTSKTQTTATVN